MRASRSETAAASNSRSTSARAATPPGTTRASLAFANPKAASLASLASLVPGVVPADGRRSALATSSATDASVGAGAAAGVSPSPSPSAMSRGSGPDIHSAAHASGGAAEKTLSANAVGARGANRSRRSRRRSSPRASATTAFIPAGSEASESSWP